MKKTKKKFEKYTIDMTDDEMYAFVEQFINSTSVVKGGGIKVSITAHHTSIEGDYERKNSLKYEDACYINELIDGATQFLLWMRRDGIYREIK
jgi:hypothetical protein